MPYSCQRALNRLCLSVIVYGVTDKERLDDAPDVAAGQPDPWRPYTMACARVTDSPALPARGRAFIITALCGQHRQTLFSHLTQVQAIHSQQLPPPLMRCVAQRSKPTSQASRLMADCLSTVLNGRNANVSSVAEII